MEKSVSVFFGFVAVILVVFVVVVYISQAGRCSITDCKTEIEIISSEIPDLVDEGDRIQVELIVKNKGDVKAENCVLEWHLIAYRDAMGDAPNETYLRETQFSETFQLFPSEKIKIETSNKKALYQHELVPDRSRISSSVFVVCDNTESPKVSKTTYFRKP